MTSKHTPGPWKLYPAEETSPAVICDADDCPVVEVYDTKRSGWMETGERVLRAVNNHDALTTACEATDKALTDIQALMRQKGWKIEETDTLDFQLYSTLAEASYKAHAALSKPKEV